MSRTQARYAILATILFIAGVHIFAMLNDYYFYFRWLDIPMHMLGGFWIGLVAVTTLQWKQGRAMTIEERLAYTFLIAFGIGVFWEFFEYCSDTLFHLESYVYDAEDTFSDLLNDFIGGTVAGLIGKVHIHRNEQT